MSKRQPRRRPSRRVASDVKPDVTVGYMEYLVLIEKAAKCDRLVAAFEKEKDTA